MSHFESLLNEVKEFVEKEGISYNDFAVFGSGPLAVRGIRESRDIDIIIRPYIFKELSKKYVVDSRGYICQGNIEIAGDWEPWFKDINILIDDADIINGIRYVKLKYVLEWKKAFNREKDKKDIALIESYLKTQRL
ncbi:MAG: hypothetical protein N3G19_00110 [Candidatus Pacearchaeota archaeon]|nr:hypothetical protein [Candidatus Pacearchaeota archaeon]